MNEVILKRFERPDETRLFEKGKFELIQDRRDGDWAATCEPGGDGPSNWAKHCARARAMWSMSGWWSRVAPRVVDLFHFEPGQDSWGGGDEPTSRFTC
jgi:hypothetical protein